MYPQRFKCPQCDGHGSLRTNKGKSEFCTLCHGAKAFYITHIEWSQGGVWQGRKVEMRATAFAATSPVSEPMPFPDVELERPGQGNISELFAAERKLKKEPKKEPIKRDNAKWNF